MSRLKVNFFNWYYRVNTEAGDAILKMYLVSRREEVAEGDNLLVILGKSRLKANNHAWFIGVGYQPHLGKFLSGIYNLSSEEEAENVLRNYVVRDFDKPELHLHLLFNLVPLQGEQSIVKSFELAWYNWLGTCWEERHRITDETFVRDPNWRSLQDCQTILDNFQNRIMNDINAQRR